MRTARMFLASCLVGCCFVSTATAADVGEPMAQQEFEERWSWTGFNVGVDVGYSLQSDETDPARVPFCFNPECAAEGEGLIGGLFAGYNHQFGSFVAGVEGGYTYIDNLFEDAALVTVRDAWTVQAKLGYAIDRALVYGHLGGSYASTTSPTPGLSRSAWGWVFGAGVDVAITDNIFTGIKYSHHTYDDFAGLPIDAQMNEFKLRTGYKF